MTVGPLLISQPINSIPTATTQGVATSSLGSYTNPVNQLLSSFQNLLGSIPTNNSNTLNTTTIPVSPMGNITQALTLTGLNPTAGIINATTGTSNNFITNMTPPGTPIGINPGGGDPITNLIIQQLNKLIDNNPTIFPNPDQAKKIVLLMVADGQRQKGFLNDYTADLQNFLTETNGLLTPTTSGTMSVNQDAVTTLQNDITSKMFALVPNVNQLQSASQAAQARLVNWQNQTPAQNQADLDTDTKYENALNQLANLRAVQDSLTALNTSPVDAQNRLQVIGPQISQLQSQISALHQPPMRPGTANQIQALQNQLDPLIHEQQVMEDAQNYSTTDKYNQLVNLLNQKIQVNNEVGLAQLNTALASGSLLNTGIGIYEQSHPWYTQLI